MTRPSGLMAVLVLMLLGAAQCIGADWQFQVGRTLNSGLFEVNNLYTDNIEDGGADVSPSFMPVLGGIQGSVLCQFNHGSKIGFDMGPGMVIYVYEVTGGDSWSYVGLPVGVYYGFTFLPHSSVSPHARVGIKYHIAGGDYVESSEPGAYGSIGIEFLRRSPIGVGVELGYDAATVNMVEFSGTATEEKAVQPGGVSLAIYARF